MPQAQAHMDPQGIVGDIIARLAPLAGNLAGQAAPLIPFAAGPQPQYGLRS